MSPAGGNSNEVLSQDELDALLQGVDSGEVDVQPAAAPGEVRGFDFASQDHIVRGRLPTLEMINERFMRLWRIGLFNMLHRSPNLQLVAVDMVKFGEYVHSLHVPTNLNLVRVKPLRGTALVMIEPGLVFSVVDSFFGGGKHAGKIEGREFTPTEMRVIQLMLKQIFSDLSEAWAPVLPVEFEHVSSEVNPHFANIIAPREYIVVIRLRAELDGSGGELHVALPWAMLEPIRDLLDAGIQSDRVERDEGFSVALREHLPDAEVEISATLARVRSTLRELLSLKAGDVLHFEMPQRITLAVEELPLFEGEYGVANGQRAIRITDTRSPAKRRRASSGAPA